MKLLILGGTAWLGRAVAEHARDAGHAVTCCARGTSPAPPGVDFVVADRDDDAALVPLRDQVWDAVVDVSSQPGHVRRAARELEAAHWIYISSSNVYRSFAALEPSEEAAIHEPLVADSLDSAHDYGAAKVACEDAVRSTAGTWTVIRSGLITGPGDTSGRGTYYVWRFANPTGPNVLVPDDLDFPCAMIDVDDLARWIVHCAEHRVSGVFNATGPTMSLGEVVTVSRDVAGSEISVLTVPLDVLAAQAVNPWAGPKSLPLWIDDPNWRYFMTMDTTGARSRGLRTRPLAETLNRALDQDQRRGDVRGAGLSHAEECELRAACAGDSLT